MRLEGGIFESGLGNPWCLVLPIICAYVCGEPDAVIILGADDKGKEVDEESSGGDPQHNARGPPSDSPWCLRMSAYKNAVSSMKAASELLLIIL